MIKFDSKNLENKMSLLKKWFETQFTQDALVLGSNNLAVKVRNRVEKSGTKADGGSFGGYSTKTTLVGPDSFRRESSWTEVMEQANNKEENLSAIHWVTIPVIASGFVRKAHLIVLPGGYKKIRELDGQQTDHKSFNRTTQMWRNFGVKPEKTRPFHVFIGGKNQESQSKINWNSARERVNIIDPSTSEEKILTDFVNQVVQKKIKQYFA